MSGKTVNYNTYLRTVVPPIPGNPDGLVHVGNGEWRKPATKHCGCCERDVPASRWDGLYGSCGDCAFCSSLEHFDPCCHGACKLEKV